MSFWVLICKWLPACNSQVSLDAGYLLWWCCTRSIMQHFPVPVGSFAFSLHLVYVSTQQCPSGFLTWLVIKDIARFILEIHHSYVNKMFQAIGLLKNMVRCFDASGSHMSHRCGEFILAHFPCSITLIQINLNPIFQMNMTCFIVIGM